MSFLTDEQRRQMLANGVARARGEDADLYPVVKLYTPDAGASWVLTALDADGDLAYGLIDADQFAAGSTDWQPVAMWQG